MNGSPLDDGLGIGRIRQVSVPRVSHAGTVGFKSLQKMDSMPEHRLGDVLIFTCVIFVITLITSIQRGISSPVRW